MCDCHKIRKQITFSIDFDAPITVALVVVCTVVLLGDAVTNTQHCTLAQDTGYYTLATAKSPGPQPEPEWTGGYVEAVAPQDSFEPWDGGQPKLQPESESEPEPEPEPPQSKFVAAQSALEDHIGCGLNAWMFTCYTHDYYDSFSAAFIPRIFTWCLGSISFDEYKVNMIFLLLLGPQCERKIEQGGLGAWGVLGMLSLTALWGGLFTLSISSAALIGSSGLIFAVLLARVLPSPRKKKGRGGQPAEFDLGSLIVRTFTAGP